MRYSGQSGQSHESILSSFFGSSDSVVPSYLVNLIWAHEVGHFLAALLNLPVFLIYDVEVVHQLAEPVLIQFAYAQALFSDKLDYPVMDLVKLIPIRLLNDFRQISQHDVLGCGIVQRVGFGPISLIRESNQGFRVSGFEIAIPRANTGLNRFHSRASDSACEGRSRFS